MTFGHFRVILGWRCTIAVALCRAVHCYAEGQADTEERDRLMQDAASTPAAQDRIVSAIIIQRGSVAAQNFADTLER